jgi:hypothetical protein
MLPKSARQAPEGPGADVASPLQFGAAQRREPRGSSESPWGAKRSVAHSEAKLAQREPADVDDMGRLEIPATASLQHKHRWNITRGSTPHRLAARDTGLAISIGTYLKEWDAGPGEVEDAVYVQAPASRPLATAGVPLALAQAAVVRAGT